MATYYVSSAGSDSNAGTSTAAPWLTVAKVNTATIANDTVLFNRGDTFNDAALTCKNGQTIGDYGNSASPAVLDGHNAYHTVIVSATTGVTINNLSLKNRLALATIYHCILADTTLNTLTVNDVMCTGGLTCFFTDIATSGSGNVFNRCYFTRSWDDGVSMHGIALTVTFNWPTWWRTGVDQVGSNADPVSSHETCTFTVNDGLFYSCSRGMGLSVHTAGTVAFNRCLCITTSETTSGGNYIVALNNTGIMTVTNCIIIMTGTTVQYGFYNNGGTFTAYNNSVISTNSNAGSIAIVSVAGTTTFRNNISIMPTGLHAWDASAGVNTLTSNNNCFNPDGAAVFAATAAPITGNFATWQGLGKDANSFITAASVYNSLTPTGSPDARLKAGSPCIATGAAGLTTTDFHNRTRLTDGDLGAIQYHAGYLP